jgi:hypothetical protein
MRHLWKPAALAVACAAAVLMQAAPASADETATVEQDANLRAEPDTDSEVLDELAAGSTVEVVCWSTGEEAIEADVAPLRVDDPGYGTHLDDDLDGIGCEWVPEDK